MTATIRSFLVAAARARSLRTVAGVLGFFIALGLLYWSNLSIAESQRQLVNGTDTHVSHLIAAIATAPQFITMLLLCFANSVRSSQPRGLSAAQIFGFTLLIAIFLAFWVVIVIGVAIHPEMIW